VALCVQRQRRCGCHEQRAGDQPNLDFATEHFSPP
jgi:hypothetical protein